MISITIAALGPGNNQISVRIDGSIERSWRSSPARGDFDELHAEAHRVALQIAREFLQGVVCRWCEVRSGEGGIR
ncbi:MAG: hypothetical protein ACR2PL_06640 [Dehalococcoidia bacterium]